MAVRILNGGADRDQTDALVVANDALYQLSYCPEGKGSYLKFLACKSTPNLGHPLFQPGVVSLSAHPGEDHLARPGGQEADDLNGDVLADVWPAAGHDHHGAVGQVA